MTGDRRSPETGREEKEYSRMQDTGPVREEHRERPARPAGAAGYQAVLEAPVWTLSGTARQKPSSTAGEWRIKWPVA